MSSVSTTRAPTPLRPDAHEGSNGTAAMRQHAPEIAAHQAIWLLRIGFTVAPILFGLDKFFNWSVDWPDYLAGWINSIAPGSGQDFMYFVGGVEILAGFSSSWLLALAPSSSRAGWAASSSTC